jgi:hypothetical protein
MLEKAFLIIVLFLFAFFTYDSARQPEPEPEKRVKKKFESKIFCGNMPSVRQCPTMDDL